MSAIAQQLGAVRERIARATERAGRPRGAARLVAVTKTFGADAIEAAYAAGQRCFGENYAQELDAKAAVFAALPGAEVRVIGNVQRRKVKGLLAHPFVVAIESVDDGALAQEIEKRAAALGRSIEVLIQVNVGREPQKSGCLPEALGALVAEIRALPHLRLTGLMTVPPHTDDPEGARPHFRALRALADAHGLPECSMGMSHDLEVAVSEGASLVRVGTAIFGARG